MRAPMLIGNMFDPGKLGFRFGIKDMIWPTLGRPCTLVIAMRDEYAA